MLILLFGSLLADALCSHECAACARQEYKTVLPIWGVVFGRLQEISASKNSSEYLAVFWLVIRTLAFCIF